ncbi:hypothetical protein Q9L58_007853 [Maublancomyces gigas]|uniref:Pentatricopeptide repeat-containing protein n=1 Tax=Discina gigas TaxID=1032678 RepID=A0ABR3GBJ8_9PEZI
MRPLHAIAPSTRVLRYLRQILFPRPHEYPVCIASNCARPRYCENHFLSQQHRGVHTGVLVENYGGEQLQQQQQQQQQEEMTPLLAPPVRQAWAKGRAGWNMNKKKKALWERPLRKAGVSGPSPNKGWHLQCRRLIHQKRLSEAMAQWLDAKNKNAEQGDVEKLGKALMKAFNRNQRARGTPQIFATMVAHDPSSIDTRCLNLVLEAYLINNRPEKLTEVFKHYKNIVNPDWMTFDIILRNFIAMRRLGDAEGLVRILLDNRGPVTPSSFATLLDGVNQKTGDLVEMQRIVEWMKTTGVDPHKSIYNIMIKAALDNGRYTMARGYAEEMVARGLQYNTDTFVLFLSTQSVAGDWVGVRRTMERMHAHNLMISTEGFSTLLHSYAATAVEIDHIERFFESMVSAGATPGRFTFNIMVHACTRLHDSVSKERWIKRMRVAGFPPDAVTFNILFQELRKSHTPCYVLRRVYAAAVDINPNIVNARTKQILLDSMRKESILPYLPRSRATSAPRFVEQTRAMESALSADRPHDAICIFSDIISSGVKPTQPLVAAAIRATFRLPVSEHDEASRLLFIAQKRGIRVNEVVMDVIVASEPSTHAPSTDSNRLMAALDRLKTSYEFMGRFFLPVSHYVLIQSAWSLVSGGDAQGAITLLHQMANTRWGSEIAKWDMVGLTVLLRAYTVIGDMTGVGWVVDQVLQDEVLPDRRFMMYLKRAKECTQSREDEAFVGWCVGRCLKMRGSLRSEEAGLSARELLKFFGE